MSRITQLTEAQGAQLGAYRDRWLGIGLSTGPADRGACEAAVREAYVDHEEHATVILPLGDWMVRRQREYTPVGWRQVVD